MRIRRAGSALLLAALLVLPARAAEGPVLLYPPDLTLVQGEKLKLFVYHPGKGAVDNVHINGSPVDSFEGEAFRKGEVDLVPGLNILHAFGATVRLFRLPDTRMEQFRLDPGNGGVELVFRAYRLHPALDDGCDSCHAVEGGKLSAKDQKEACYACHNDFSKPEDGRKAYLHAPVATGECTGCHDPHFSAAPKLQKLSKGCLECHDAFPAEGAVHRPVADGQCMACHGPHAGPAPKQLVRPGNSLCLGCHDSPHARHRSPDIRPGGTTVVPETFPLDGGKMSCTGCHAPHQSAVRRLLKAPEPEICRSCHRA